MRANRYVVGVKKSLADLFCSGEEYTADHTIRVGGRTRNLFSLARYFQVPTLVTVLYMKTTT